MNCILSHLCNFETKVYIYADDWFYHIHAKYCISMTKHCMWFWKILPAFYTCTTNLSFNLDVWKQPNVSWQRHKHCCNWLLVTFYNVEEILKWLTWSKCCSSDVQIVKNRYNLLVVSKWENMGWQAYFISSANNGKRQNGERMIRDHLVSM